MKALLAVSIVIMSFAVSAESRKTHTPSEFDLIPINSPVKESTARFAIKAPVGFEIDELKYKIRNASRLFDKDKNYEVSKLVNGPNGKELHLLVSKLPPGFYQLFVKIKDKKSKKEHDYKNKFKDYAMFVIDESLEVPLPNDKENSKTIAGVDSDGDGIRDDVQRWINETYISNLNVKLAVKQMAINIQQELISADNVEQSRIATAKALASGTCLGTIIGMEERSKITAELHSKILNTKDRHYANIKVNSNFSGQTISIKREDRKLTCDFNPTI